MLGNGTLEKTNAVLYLGKQELQHHSTAARADFQHGSSLRENL